MPRSNSKLRLSLLLLLITGSLTSCFSVKDSLLVPRPEWLASPGDLGLAFEEFELDTGEDTTVFGWFIPNPAAEGRTLVMCHGSAANISFYHPYYEFLQKAGWNVLLFDYRGYGNSRGETNFAALFGDTERVLSYARSRADVDPKKIAIFGISLGAIVALRVAAGDPQIAAVLVEDAVSPRDTLGKAAGAFAAWWISTFSLPGKLEPSENTAAIKRPLLVLCGALDSGLASSVASYQAAGGPSACWVLPKAGHAPHTLMVHDQEYQDAVAAFLDEAIQGRVARIEILSFDHEGTELEVQLALRDRDFTEPLPVELCVIDSRGNANFTRRWMLSSETTLRMPQTSRPETVLAWPYRRVKGSVESKTWERSPGNLASAEHIRHSLQSWVDSAVDGDRLHAARMFVATLKMFDDQAPLHPLLEAELIPSYLFVAQTLLGTSKADDRQHATILLKRVLDVAPAVPDAHYWPGNPYIAGFRHSASLEEARRLLKETKQ